MNIVDGIRKMRYMKKNYNNNNRSDDEHNTILNYLENNLLKNICELKTTY